MAAYLFGKENPNYKHGKCLKKICLDCGKQLKNKYALRCKSCAQTGKLSHRYGKVSYHGIGVWYKNIWMRSSYEIKYAQWLDSKNIKWEYEPKAFKLGDATYTPDFYLPETEEWVEVKGWWRKDALEKFMLWKLFYPQLKTLLVTKECLEAGV